MQLWLVIQCKQRKITLLAILPRWLQLNNEGLCPISNINNNFTYQHILCFTLHTASKVALCIRFHFSISSKLQTSNLYLMINYAMKIHDMIDRYSKLKIYTYRVGQKGPSFERLPLLEYIRSEILQYLISWLTFSSIVRIFLAESGHLAQIWQRVLKAKILLTDLSNCPKNCVYLTTMTWERLSRCYFLLAMKGHPSPWYKQFDLGGFHFQKRTTYASTFRFHHFQPPWVEAGDRGRGWSEARLRLPV